MITEDQLEQLAIQWFHKCHKGTERSWKEAFPALWIRR